MAFKLRRRVTNSRNNNTNRSSTRSNRSTNRSSTRSSTRSTNRATRKKAPAGHHSTSASLWSRTVSRFRRVDKRHAAAMRMLNKLTLSAHKAARLADDIDAELRREAYRPRPLSQRVHSQNYFLNDMRANRNTARTLSNAALRQLAAMQAGGRWVSGPFNYNATHNNVGWNNASSKTLRHLVFKTQTLAQASDRNRQLMHVQPARARFV